jgi:two-component system, chemotaxis family, protein-glutamate methylesterase/glutaminase
MSQARRDVVVIGASAGGVEALQALMAALPAELPAAVLVVLHIPATGADALGPILDRAGPLPVRRAEHGDPLVHGQVLVGRPDHHLMVVDDAVAVTRGPRENGHRPAVDVLFRSVARELGPRVTSVVLSGTLDDGAAGSVAVSSRGGVALAQDPAEAMHSGMPVACINASGAEGLTIAGIAKRIVELVAEEVDVRIAPAPTDLMQKETAMADMDPAEMENVDRPGQPSGFSCPDCHGVLFQIEEGRMRRFRCRVGHAWSVDSLLAEHGQAVEGALWMALRSLEEKAALSTQLSDGARETGRELTAARFAEQAGEAHTAADLIRRMLMATPDIELTGDPAARHGRDSRARQGAAG